LVGDIIHQKNCMCT